MRNTYLLTLIVILALLAGSCSGDDGSAQIATLESDDAVSAVEVGESADPIAETEAAMLAFTQCLRDQGIDIDDPTMDADGNVHLAPIDFTFESENADPEAHFAAFNEMIGSCEEHLEGIATTSSDHDATEFEDNLLEYAQCMRDNGVDMPDPDFSGGAGAIELGSPDDEEFEAADAECRKHLGLLGLDE
ncbi:MAG: hypothetical protein ABFR89_05590 [Actinomycetota bacterium]